MLQKEITIQTKYIEPKRDKNGKTYFLIYDRETNLTYFAFSHQIKKGWYDLVLNWQSIKEVHLKLAGKKVVSLKVISLYPYKQVSP